MAWITNGTPDTLTGAGDTLEISDLTAKKFNTILCNAITTGTIDTNITLDNITTSTYAVRSSSDGGADGTSVSRANFNTGGDPADGFHVCYIINITSEEKLVIGKKVDASAVGAGTAPQRREWVGKSTQSAQFTQINFEQAGANSFDTNSNLSALGTD